jgi:NADPH:quinone reductase
VEARPRRFGRGCLQVTSVAPTAARAWRVQRHGTPAEALELDVVDVPEPGPGEATVAIEAVGLNFPDLLLCAGRHQESPPLPFVPGYEAAGVVRAVGPGCSVAPGDRVIVVPELTSGAYRELTTVPETEIFPSPAGIDPIIAATLHIAGVTAHAALHHRAGLRAGEWVLVTGTAGGVGSAAIGLARAAGAHVVALATGAAKAAACREMGADVVVDLAEPHDLPAVVRGATDGRGADVVVENVGGALFDRVRRCVAFEGRIVIVGFTSGVVPEVPVNHVLLRNHAVVGLHIAAYRRERPALVRAIHAEVADLCARGVVVPRLSRVLPFDRAPAALELLARREAVGRIALGV